MKRQASGMAREPAGWRHPPDSSFLIFAAVIASLALLLLLTRLLRPSSHGELPRLFRAAAQIALQHRATRCSPFRSECARRWETLLLNQKWGHFRTLLPASGDLRRGDLLWMWLFNPQLGLINRFLRHFTSNPPLWLSSPGGRCPHAIIMSLWGAGGRC